MDENINKLITEKEIIERLVSLETEFRVRLSTNREALVLAREILEKELELARHQMDDKLEHHNQWQKRWDKNEGLLATKEELAEKIQIIEEKSLSRVRALERLVYIGVGLAIAVSYFLKFINI